jgi:hypothetical protein
VTTEIRISDYSISDDTDLRTLKFNIGDKTVTTPTRAINTNQFFQNTRISPSLANLNELYFAFNEDSIKAINQKPVISRERNKEAYQSRVKSNYKPTFCLLQFKNKGLSPRYPSREEIEILINTAYSFSDITPIPSIPKISRSLDIDNFNEFLGYLTECIRTITVRNKKPIIGYIPATVPLFIRKIIDFYLDHGINAFYIDFDGMLVSTHATGLNALKVQLKKRGYEENNFLHYINVSFGKAINDQQVLSARDLLGFGYGLDSLGGVHMGPKRNPDYFNWLKTRKDVKRNANRFLNRGDYGYYRVDLLGDKISTMVPKEVPVTRSDIVSASKTRQARAFKIVNMHQQCIEAQVLQTIVSESPENTLKYYRSKQNVGENDLKLLSKSRS